MSGYDKSKARLDWTTDFVGTQWEDMQAFYKTVHSGDQADLGSLDRYVLFSHDFMPDALKRFRLWSSAIAGGMGLDDSLQDSGLVGATLSLHHYALEHNALGLRYGVNNVRRRGMKRSEVSDIFALAFLHGGPHVLNVVAHAVHDVMLDWPEDEGAGYPWSPDWSVEPDAFACGIDFLQASDDNAISDADLDLIRQWHLRVEGEVPLYVDFLAKNYPLALKVFRARYETTVQRSLPKQYVALAWLHMAVIMKRPEAVRRAMHMAHVFGVTRDQILHVIVRTHVHLGPLEMDAGLEGVSDKLDLWR